MASGKKAVIATVAYAAAGAATAYWTKTRGEKKLKAFKGFGANPSPMVGLASTVAAWPYVIHYNLSK